MAKGKRTIWYLDAENIGYKEWLEITGNMGKGDTLGIFYTENAEILTLDTLKELNAKGITVTPVKCFMGKKKSSGLDFQLASVLGYTIAKCGTKCRYRIIARDRDYDAVIAYWDTQGADIRRVSPENDGTEAAKNTEAEKMREKGNEQEAFCMELLGLGLGVTGNQAHRTAILIMDARKRPKTGRAKWMHEAMEKEFGASTGRKLYATLEAYLSKI